MAGEIQNREAFLATLKEKLGEPEYEPYTPINDLPYTTLADKSTAELLQIAHQYSDDVTHARILEINHAEMNAKIAEIIAESGGGQVMIPDDPEFDALGIVVEGDPLVKWQKGVENRETNIMAAQNSNLSIAVAKFFIAESATVAVESHAGQGRTLHFLPSHYIAVVPLSRMVPRLTQAAAYYDEHKRENSALHFITGPSNSGDIEMQLVVGLHGPLEINYLILMDK